MKHKNFIFNLCMVIAISAVAIGGFLFVKDIKTGGVSPAIASVEKTKGNVSISRGGVAYSLKKSMDLIDGDIVITSTNATASISLPNGSITMEECSSIKLNNQQITLTEGSVYGELNKSSMLALNDWQITSDDMGVFASLRGNQPNARIYSGSAVINDGKESFSLNSGEELQRDANGKALSNKLTENSLSDFEIERCLASDKQLFTEKATLEAVKKNRLLAQEKALQAQKLAKQEALAQGTKPLIEQSTSSKPQSQASNPTTPNINIDELFESIPVETNSSSIDSTNDNVNYGNDNYDDTQSNNKENKIFVTFEIECSAILPNIDNLTDGKDIYVPDNGSILSAVTVEANDGESVYELLRRLCRENGIQLETSWTPAYNSHYIEGINHLYEFDCGSGSGWVYRVNGWSPNYGVSVYKLKDGDYVTINYTCDYGNDV